MKRLTTVSYAILGLLSLRSHTPYELAQQMRRSGIFWSASESVVYDEPKNLVSHGLATAERERSNGRSRTRYTITDAGRATLRQWLHEPSGGPQVQFESMLKVLFATEGDRESLLRTIRDIREWARATQADGHAIARDYLDGAPPYPRRAHIVQLTLMYQLGFVLAVTRWADWAEAEVSGWESTDAIPALPLEVFERALRDDTP